MKCFFCKGRLENSETTHVVDLKKCLVIVRNAPCTQCVQCGESFFNDQTATELEIIVNNAKSAVTEVAIMNYSAMTA